MDATRIHRFERDGRRFAIDPETCFCFECDEISWDVLEHYPAETVNRIYAILGEKHDVKELGEVISELEWLRTTKSIFRVYTPEEIQESFKPEVGLREVHVHASGSNVRDAAAMLLARSATQLNLRINVIVNAQSDANAVADACAEAKRLAAVSGKKITIVLRAEFDTIPKAPAGLMGHRVAFEVEMQKTDALKDACAWVIDSGARPLAKTVKAMAKLEDARCRVCVRPGSPDFGNAAEVLHDAGFTSIALELEDAYAHMPEVPPEAMVAGLYNTANYYAQCLLSNKYFRLDPVADLFRRIYEGTPTRRADAAGAQSLAIAADGGIFPAPAFIGKDEFRLGQLSDGSFDEFARGAFDDVGVVTTGACRRCWARHLCGGGFAAIHHARTGGIHEPDEAWCDAQRAWYEGAVDAFNQLSSRGVNFTRMYQNLAPGAGKPSLFKMMKAAVNMTVAIRPIEESDAQMLVRWENWTEAAYFLNSESGLLIATEYDREMNALHPVTADQEMILTRRNGDAIGLLKLRPAREPESAWAWLFMPNESDYAAGDIQRGLKTLLAEAAKGQGLRNVIVRAMDTETALQQLITALGFTPIGTERQSIYLHNHYHDVNLYRAQFG